MSLVLRSWMATSVVLLMSWALPASAQPPGGPFGGPPGGFDVGEMVRRMDANGNGVIDLDEMEGRARYMLDRIARDGQIDMSKPIPVGRLVDVMRQRMSGGGPPRSDGDRGGSGDSRSDDRSRSSRDSDRGSRDGGTPAQAASLSIPSGVPGFGIVESIEPPPGFGAAPIDPYAALAKKYEQQVIDRVREAIGRYDRNGDFMLDMEELRGARWSGNPADYDKNKDGKLTIDEIAERYKDRYASGYYSSRSSSSSRQPQTTPAVAVATPSSSSRPSSGDSRGGPPGGFRGPAGPSGPAGTVVVSGPGGGGSSDSERYLRYAESMLARYDANKDGKLQRNEWTGLREPETIDKNRDGVITKEELVAWLESFSRGRTSSGDSRSSSSSSSSSGRGSRSSDSSAAAQRKSYRFLTPAERLPEGLPDWFARLDANGDGQIMMYEFSAKWTEEKAEEFAGYDLNGDGVITPDELLATARNDK